MHKVYIIVFYFVCLVLLLWVDPAWALDLEKQTQVSASIVQVVEFEDPDVVTVDNCFTTSVEADEECELVFDVLTKAVFDENLDFYVISENYE